MSEAAKPIWDEHSDRAFAEMQAPLDRELGPLGRAAMAVLAPKVGEKILDIGCGTGETTAELAAAVGAGGQVLGVDISGQCLGIARTRLAQFSQVELTLGDAQIFDFPRQAFDAAFSRFGVMFFADPAVAFANIRKGLKPGGRLAFVCWRDPKEAELLSFPFQVVKDLLPEQPPPDPDAPGPFGLANAERTRRLLGEAGFQDIQIKPHDSLATAGDVDTTLALALRVGVLGRLVRENPEYRDVVTGPLRTALAARSTAEGVMLKAACWIVTARA